MVWLATGSEINVSRRLEESGEPKATPWRPCARGNDWTPMVRNDAILIEGHPRCGSWVSRAA